ncbi:MAG: DUF5996 family protein [Gaiellaceae bacterium]
MERFPPLVDWSATRDTLHAYSRVAGSILRAHAEATPDWTHVSLMLEESGLASRAFTMRRGDVTMLLDLQRHRFELSAPGGVASISLDGGLSGTELAEEIVRRGEALDVKLHPELTHYEDDRPTGYHTAKAEAYLQALLDVNGVFTAVRGEFSGDVTGVRLWPHHFDLSFEWHGKEVTFRSKDGTDKAVRASITVGFSTGDTSEPGGYLYANPWPFDEELAAKTLPGEARWYTDEWKGSMLPYASIAGTGEQPVYDYLVAVYEHAAPGLAG